MEDLNKYKVDVLAFGAHPDDVELSAGGAVAKLVKEGKKVAIVDFTRGESGSRGTPEQRLREADKAGKILGIICRENLCFPDTRLQVTEEAIQKTIEVIRKYRPDAVLMNPAFERHPDHEAAHMLVRNAMFKSGLIKYETDFEGKLLERHRIRKMFSYMQSYIFQEKPSFVVDISDTFDQKMKSIKAYSSQVFVPGESDPEGPVTRLSRPEFLEEIESRAIYWGTHIGVRYAEPFVALEPLGITNFSSLL